MELITNEEMLTKFIGEPGSEERKSFQLDLDADIAVSMIKAIRKKHGLSQAQLGELIGVKKARMSRIENSGDIKIKTFMKILGVMGYSIDFKVTNKNEK